MKRMYHPEAGLGDGAFGGYALNTEAGVTVYPHPHVDRARVRLSPDLVLPPRGSPTRSTTCGRVSVRAAKASSLPRSSRSDRFSRSAVHAAFFVPKRPPRFRWCGARLLD